MDCADVTSIREAAYGTHSSAWRQSFLCSKHTRAVVVYALNCAECVSEIAVWWSLWNLCRSSPVASWWGLSLSYRAFWLTPPRRTYSGCLWHFKHTNTCLMGTDAILHIRWQNFYFYFAAAIALEAPAVDCVHLISWSEQSECAEFLEYTGERTNNLTPSHL